MTRSRVAVRCGLMVLIVAAGSPAPALAQQDAVAADTVVADTALTARERALQRLRALPRTPVQPDTTAADSLAVDSLVADTAVADTTAAAAPDAAVPRIETPDIPGVPVTDTARGDSGAVIVVGPNRRAAPPDRPVVADSVLPLLRGLEGYAVTEYSGDALVFHADSNRLRLLGSGRVGQQQRSLETDSLLVYDAGTGVVCGYGNPVLSGEQEPVESRRVCYSIERNLGVAEAARTTTMAQGATWYVRGAENRVYLLTGGERNRMYGEHAEFTTCDLPEPHYTFRARSLKAEDEGMMVARDVTLRFEDVPVFWLPWLVQSTKRGRRSGLLRPQFGVNEIVRNSSDYNRHITDLGFYWAINDYMSAQGTFDWFSNNYTALEGAFAYRWLRQFLNGQVAIKRYWRESGRRELTLNTSNSWRPDERTSLNASGSFATSTDFVKRNSFDPRELNRSITFSANGTRNFDWGTVTTGYQRQQRLTDERIDQTFPSVDVSFSPRTLYTSADGGTQLTWNGSGNFQQSSVDVLDSIPDERDRMTRRADFSHRIGFGRISLGQSISWDEDVDRFKPVSGFATPGGLPVRSPFDDIIPAADLPEESVEALRWSSSLSYQQNLWTGTTLSPNLSVTQDRRRTPETDGAMVAAPLRISTGASVNTTVFGFWPGVGPFSRIRHKISPSLSWSYSPAPEATSALQDSLFGVSNLREQHRVSLSINQTFEAKYAESDTVAEAVDTTASADGEPRRLPQAEKITLLAINTSPSFVYDFVAREEEGRGFLTERVSNSIRSDLLQGFQLSVAHDLFREEETELEGAVPDRSFDPFLTNLSARFSIDNEFWLFRFLGLSGGPPPDSLEAESPEEEGVQGVSGGDDTGMIGAEADPSGIDRGSSIIPGRETPGQGVRSRLGGWRASLDYSLVRAREGENAGRENQMLRGNFSFQPTEHWQVRWSTGYSFTAGEFSDHVLTLTRDLHRWQANFDFIKAQNGNFALQFRVSLKDNPDLKLDYDQRTDPSQVRQGQSAQ